MVTKRIPEKLSDSRWYYVEEEFEEFQLRILSTKKGDYLRGERGEINDVEKLKHENWSDREVFWPTYVYALLWI